MPTALNEAVFLFYISIFMLFHVYLTFYLNLLLTFINVLLIIGVSKDF